MLLCFFTSLLQLLFPALHLSTSAVFVAGTSWGLQWRFPQDAGACVIPQTLDERPLQSLWKTESGKAAPGFFSHTRRTLTALVFHMDRYNKNSASRKKTAITHNKNKIPFLPPNKQATPPPKKKKSPTIQLTKLFTPQKQQWQQQQNNPKTTMSKQKATGTRTHTLKLKKKKKACAYSWQQKFQKASESRVA